MTDAEIELYAALRVTVRPDWEIATRRSPPDTPARSATVTVYFERLDVARQMRHHYAHMVPLPILEDARLREGTIRLAVSQVRQLIATPGPNLVPREADFAYRP